MTNSFRNNELDEELEKWKKKTRDTGKPLRYADSFREGWERCKEVSYGPDRPGDWNMSKYDRDEALKAATNLESHISSGKIKDKVVFGDATKAVKWLREIVNLFSIAEHRLIAAQQGREDAIQSREEEAGTPSKD